MCVCVCGVFFFFLQTVTRGDVAKQTPTSHPALAAVEMEPCCSQDFLCHLLSLLPAPVLGAGECLMLGLLLGVTPGARSCPTRRPRAWRGCPEAEGLRPFWAARPSPVRANGGWAWGCHRFQRFRAIWKEFLLGREEEEEEEVCFLPPRGTEQHI